MKTIVDLFSKHGTLVQKDALDYILSKEKPEDFATELLKSFKEIPLVLTLEDIKKIEEFKQKEILVAKQTNPDWEPIMKIASGIITERGGSTSHASIVSRELGIPCIVGAKDAMKKLRN